MKTFVYIDHFKGDVQPASWEALGLAKSFGTTVALVFGAGVDEVAKAALEYASLQPGSITLELPSIATCVFNSLKKISAFHPKFPTGTSPSLKRR